MCQCPLLLFRQINFFLRFGYFRLHSLKGSHSSRGKHSNLRDSCKVTILIQKYSPTTNKKTGTATIKMQISRNKIRTAGKVAWTGFFGFFPLRLGFLATQNICRQFLVGWLDASAVLAILQFCWLNFWLQKNEVVVNSLSVWCDGARLGFKVY